MVTNPESRGVQNVWIPGLRATAHPGMTPGKPKRRTVITLSHSKQPAGVQLFAAIRSARFSDFAGDRGIVVLDLFSLHVMLWP
jgi:hypothetical protein